MVTGSFDATAGLWSYKPKAEDELEQEVKFGNGDGSDNEEEEEDEWEFTLVLEGHENEVKGLSFTPSGQYLATCSRDKSVWIWEDVSLASSDIPGIPSGEGEDEWETVAVLTEHEGDVKAVAWAPSQLPNSRPKNASRYYSAECLASASYDNTVRIWREDAAEGPGEWVCVAVLEGHEGTVWSLQWESKEREDGRFPRLMTCSADGTVRVWRVKHDEDEDQDEGQGLMGRFGAIPNTMRRSLKEEWECEAVLPRVHSRDVYSISWSAKTGLVASTGSDGVVAIYAEDPDAQEEGVSRWSVIGTVKNAHGPYEVNHVTWCKRWDAGIEAERRGKEEMLVTTGDDGVVKAWEVRVE